MVYQIETTGYYGKNPFRSKKGKGWKKATKSDKNRTSFHEIRMSEGGFKTKKEAKKQDTHEAYCKNCNDWEPHFVDMVCTTCNKLNKELKDRIDQKKKTLQT